MAKSPRLTPEALEEASVKTAAKQFPLLPGCKMTVPLHRVAGSIAVP